MPQCAQCGGQGITCGIDFIHTPLCGFQGLNLGGQDCEAKILAH